MIRVRLLSEKAYTELWHDEKRYRSYDEGHFYDLLREKGDFADAESLALLRHLHGEAAVAGKWYRRTTTDGKPCIPAISREAMYGLVVIENSRKGFYTPIEEAFTDFEVQSRMETSVGIGSDHDNPLVWTALAAMNMDILLTYRIKDFFFGADIPIEEEFILENYPMGGVLTDVHVVREYLREPELRDGVWYVHNSFYDLKYRWSKDTAEVLDILRHEFAGQPPLAKGVYSLEAFEDMCWPKDAYSHSRLSRMQQEREEAEAMGIPYEAEKDPWQVINHMEYLPAEGESRRLLYLIIEAYSDGQFCLRDDISVKYPTYGEMLYEAKDMKKPNCEIFMLPVDVNEVMGRAADIRKAVCAFRVTEDVIETFGPVEGLREFEKTLRRAVESGCGGEPNEDTDSE